MTTPLPFADTAPTDAHRRPSTAPWLAVAALGFVTYPAMRPYGPESGMEGAHDFASAAWTWSHLLGVLAFAALAFGMRAAARDQTLWAGPWLDAGPERPRATSQRHRWAAATEIRAWSALVLLLPYYGAEAFGLAALGRHALTTGDASVLDAADDFRYSAPALTLFVSGLVLLMVVGGRIVHGTFAGPTALRVGGLLTGAMLTTYALQYFCPPWVRIAHGALLALGLALMALAGRGR